MDSCIDQTEKSQDSPKKISKHLDEIGGAEANNAMVEPTLWPITPDSNTENGDFPLDLSSPPIVVKKLPNVFTFNSKSNGNEDPVASINDCSSPQTPKDGVFDPFAPGPNEMVLAPLCKKSLNEARPNVARRLSFDSSLKVLGNMSHIIDAEYFSDKDMFESVYENLLEVIISNQTEDALTEMSNVEWDSESCRTPPSGSRLSGATETCPGAPLKQKGKSKIIDLGFCQKLEF